MEYGDLIEIDTEISNTCEVVRRVRVTKEARAYRVTDED
jgi:hypothetical protein